VDEEEESTAGPEAEDPAELDEYKDASRRSSRRRSANSRFEPYHTKCVPSLAHAAVALKSPRNCCNCNCVDDSDHPHGFLAPHCRGLDLSPKPSPSGHRKRAPIGSVLDHEVKLESVLARLAHTHGANHPEVRVTAGIPLQCGY
jgi:hypothetical protein